MPKYINYKVLFKFKLLIEMIIPKLRNTRDQALKQVRHESAKITRIFEEHKREAEVDRWNIEKHYEERQRKIINGAKDEFKKFTT